MSIDFVTGPPLLIIRKSNSYNPILVVVDCLTKMVYYKLIKTTIDTASLAKIIIYIKVRYYSLSEFIIYDQGLLFTSKFWSSLYYFFSINWKPSTVFYLLTDGQTERQNSIIKVYLRIFNYF